MTDESEIIEGEAVDVSENNALIVAQQNVAAAPATNPVWDIGALSDEEFEDRQKMLTQGIKRIEALQRSILIEDKGKGGDWGTIKGVDRPIIYKSGAEKLDQFYRLVPTFRIERTEDTAEALGTDPVRPNRITYTAHTDLHAGSQDGPVVGQGIGVCSSWEKKYLYRTGGRVCPTCGLATLRMGDKKDGSGKEWYCWKKLDPNACGERFAIDDPAIAAGAPEVLNMEPWDLENTLVKMATKRSHVDATLRTLGASALFTQDLEDTKHDDGVSAASGVPSTNATTQRSTAPSSRGAAAGGVTPPAAGDSQEWIGTIGKGMAPEKVGEYPVPDWYDKLPPESTIATLNLAFNVNGKKHTAIILGDAAYAVLDAHLAEGDEVRTDGVYGEHVWQEGKPPMRQIRWVTRVDVKAGDDWQPVVGPDTDNTAPPADDRDEIVPAPDGSIAEDDLGRHMAQEVERMMGYDIAKSEPEPLTAKELLESLPPASGIGDLDATLAILSMREDTTRSGKKFFEVKATNADTPKVVYSMVMQGDDPEAEHIRKTFAVGQVARFAGVWQGSIVLLSGAGEV